MVVAILERRVLVALVAVVLAAILLVPETGQVALPIQAAVGAVVALDQAVQVVMAVMVLLFCLFQQQITPAQRRVHQR